MTRAHDTALLERLRNDPQLTPCVFDETPPNTAKFYLRVRSNTGTVTADRLTGPLGVWRKTWWLTGVGTTRTQTAFLLENAVEALLNHLLVVPGWSCQRLDLMSSQPVDVDPDVPGRFFGVDTWDVVTERLPV